MIEHSYRYHALRLLLLTVLCGTVSACGDDPPSDFDDSDNVPPVAAFDAPETVAVGETFIFDASLSQDEDGEIASFIFEIEAEPLIQTRSPELVFAFDASGTFEVALTVIDDRGTKDTARRTINVTDLEP